MINALTFTIFTLGLYFLSLAVKNVYLIYKLNGE